MIFIETSIFARKRTALLTDDEYRLLQEELMGDPEIGDEIRGSGGIRKIRWSAKGQGKRGGCRAIYYWFRTRDIILFLYAYGKNEQGNLTSEQVKIMKRVVEEEFKGGRR